MIPDNIPVGALPVIYVYGGSKGKFFVWLKKGKWQWSALGNCGEEATQDLAIEAGRQWIINSDNRTRRQG